MCLVPTSKVFCPLLIAKTAASDPKNLGKISTAVIIGLAI